MYRSYKILSWRLADERISVSFTRGYVVSDSYEDEPALIHLGLEMVVRKILYLQATFRTMSEHLLESVSENLESRCC